MMKQLLFAALVSVLLCAPARSQEREAPAMPHILPLAERAALQNRLLKHRLDALIPELMRRDGVDMWILIAREYNEDPVARTMLPPTWLSARRSTILIFHDRGAERGVERMAVARYPVGDLFPAAWDPERQPDQWARVSEIVSERDPRTIAVNISDEFPLVDGLTVSQYRALLSALGEGRRVVSSDRLGLGWLETRTPEEAVLYPQVVRIAHAVLAEALSEQALTPGVTTTEQLSWWLRERVAELKLETWFHPSVNVQRPQLSAFEIATMGIGRGTVIQPGDLIHVDFGILYLGLATDIQHHAYVLRPGETDAPKGLRDALAAGNRAQDLIMREFRVARTGNEVLAAAQRSARAERLDATFYSHAIGTHGHGAGPWIGMWDNQDPVPGWGDYPIHPMTAWSIELSVRRALPDWGGQEVRIMLEEDAFFDGREMRWLDGRQSRFHLVPRP
jgi:hypothetical protein